MSSFSCMSLSNKPCRFKLLPGKGGKTQWATFNATSLPSKAGLNCLLETLSIEGRDAKSDLQWWQTIFMRSGLFVKHISQSSVWLCMGTLHEGVCCILWPAEKITVPGCKRCFWAPKTNVQSKHDLRSESVFSLKSWQVLPTKVWSPVHSFLQKAKFSGLCHVQVGKPTPLLQYAAENAFWDIPTRYLKRLRKAGL